MARCTTQDCGREGVTQVGKCKTCYAYFSRWQKGHSPGAMRSRQATIEVWHNRLSEMLKPRRVKVKKRARS